MSDPRYDSPRYERSHRDDMPLEAVGGGAGVWVMIALGIMITMALTWFSVAPLENTHETAANRPPLTEIETDGRADRSTPQEPRSR